MNSFLEDLENLSDDELNNNNIQKNDLNSAVDKTLHQKYNNCKFINKSNKQHSEDKIKEIEDSNTAYISNLNLYNLSFRHELIKKTNDLIVDINHDIILIGRYTKELYNERFPELETIIFNPYEYAVVVKSLGNKIDIAELSKLKNIPNNNIMAINIMSSTTTGKLVSNKTMQIILETCDDIIYLHHEKEKLIKLIEEHLGKIAPNLTALVGLNIATKLITAAGGILELSKMPAGNILVMGAQKVNLEGFSTAGKLHQGFLAELDEVKQVPEEVKKNILRKYAGKVALAARCDAFSTNSVTITRYNKDKNNTNNIVDKNSQKFDNYFDSNTEIDSKNQTKRDAEGKKLKEFIGKKMQRIIEPQAVKLSKALPRPDDKPRRKRGGRAKRSLAKRMELTEARRLKNRMKFGTESEAEYQYTGKGYGMLGGTGTGSRIKIVQKNVKINTKKNKQINSEVNKESMKSGLYTASAYSQNQGIELVNPQQLQQRLNTANEKYFDANSGFATVISNRQKSQIGGNSLA